MNVGDEVRTKYGDIGILTEINKIADSEKWFGHTTEYIVCFNDYQTRVYRAYLPNELEVVQND